MVVKTKTFKDLLGIDEIDGKIIDMIELNPEISHLKIAKAIERSQPAVGARIIKLKRNRLLSKQVGISLMDVDLKVAILFISTKEVEEIIKKIKECPFVSYAFKITGEYNIFCFIVAPTLTIINKIVNFLRKDQNITNFKLNFLIEPILDFVIPIHLAAGKTYINSLREHIINKDFPSSEYMKLNKKKIKNQNF